MKKNKKKKRKPTKTTCIYIKGVPIILKNYYKAYCAKRDITMSDDIMNHMKKTTKMARQADEDMEYEPEV
jgi:hypothetical protein